MVLPVLQCLTSLTYHFGDGTYFRGTVDNTGRPAQGELYTKDQQLRYNGSWRGGLFHGKGVWKEAGHTYKGGFLYGKAAGEGVWETDKGELIEGHLHQWGTGRGGHRGAAEALHPLSHLSFEDEEKLEEAVNVIGLAEIYLSCRKNKTD